MGYALFLARKLSLQTKKNNYNMQLMQLNREQERLTNQIAQNRQKNNKIDAAQSMGQTLLQIGGTAAGAYFGGLTGAQMGSELGSYAGKFVNGAIDQGQEAQQQIQEAQLTAKQNEIDTEKARLETLIQAADDELKQINQSMKSAIENSTPSYVG